MGCQKEIARAIVDKGADYVLSFTTDVVPTDMGRQTYEDNCAACHAEDGTGDQGLPLGVQIVTGYGEDAKALAVADWIERALQADQ